MFHGVEITAARLPSGETVFFLHFLHAFGLRVFANRYSSYEQAILAAEGFGGAYGPIKDRVHESYSSIQKGIAGSGPRLQEPIMAPLPVTLASLSR